MLKMVLIKLSVENMIETTKGTKQMEEEVKNTHLGSNIILPISYIFFLEVVFHLSFCVVVESKAKDFGKEQEEDFLPECRICKSDEGRLVSPCLCSGKYIPFRNLYNCCSIVYTHA